MQKPHLIIVERIRKIPTIGGCSACPDVRFQLGGLIGKVEESERKMHHLFAVHVHEAHLREDARQGALQGNKRHKAQTFCETNSPTSLVSSPLLF
jgi:hypothetical protein